MTTEKYVKVICTECTLEFDGKIETDELGEYCICPNCLFIIDVKTTENKENKKDKQ